MTIFRRLIRTSTKVCVARVHLSELSTITRRRRVSMTARLGVPPEQCAMRATHERTDDHRPLCRQHAATEALHLLTAEEKRSVRKTREE